MNLTSSPSSLSLVHSKYSARHVVPHLIIEKPLYAQEAGNRLHRTDLRFPFYPKVEGSWSDAEKLMAFQQIIAALAQADLDQRARILALADRLDLMTTAESILADWERRVNRHWADFSFLTSSCGISPRELRSTTRPRPRMLLSSSLFRTVR